MIDEANSGKIVNIQSAVCLTANGIFYLNGVPKPVFDARASQVDSMMHLYEQQKKARKAKVIQASSDVGSVSGAVILY